VNLKTFAGAGNPPPQKKAKQNKTNKQTKKQNKKQNEVSS